MNCSCKSLFSNCNFKSFFLIYLPSMHFLNVAENYKFHLVFQKSRNTPPLYRWFISLHVNCVYTPVFFYLCIEILFFCCFVFIHSYTRIWMMQKNINCSWYFIRHDPPAHGGVSRNMNCVCN